MLKKLQEHEAEGKNLEDAKRAAKKRAEKIQEEAKKRQQILEGQLVAETARSREKEDQAKKKADERAKRIVEDGKKLNQIVRDKERREKDANNAIEARRAVMKMVQKNKIKKKELRRVEAVAAATAKVEERKSKLEEKVKRTEQISLKKAKKQRLKLERNEKKVDMKTQKMEEEFSDMQSKLKKIEATEIEARKQLKKPTYSVTNDDGDDDHNDNIGELLERMQARANVLIFASEPTVLEDVEHFDTNIELDFELDDHLNEFKVLEDAEAKRQEIEKKLIQSKESIANKKSKEAWIRLMEEDDDNGNDGDNNREELALMQARESARMLASEPTALEGIKAFDNDFEVDVRLIEFDDLGDAEENRREIETTLIRSNKIYANKKYRADDEIVEADNIGSAYARAASAVVSKSSRFLCEEKESFKKEKKTKKTKKKKGDDSSSGSEKKSKGKKKKSSEKSNFKG